jgi:hypothetical protein
MELPLIPENGGRNSFGPLPGLRELLSKPLPKLADSLPPLRTGESLFELISQPNRKQRKSYQNENRYILPNPIVVKPLANRNVIDCLRGTAEVSLVYENGIQLPQGSLEGELLRPLDGRDKEAIFQLKLLVITPKRLRLSFRIRYFLNCPAPNSNASSNACPPFEEYQETLLSQPFEVHSNSTRNRKAFLVPYPTVHKITPTGGFQGSEVWIKGVNFHSSCGVRFGHVWAQLLEVSPNLIACRVPFLPRNSGRLEDEIVIPLLVYNFQSEMERDEADCLPSNAESFRYGLEGEKKDLREG